MDIHFRKVQYTDLEFINNVRNQYADEYLHDSRKFTIDETINWFENQKPDYWMILDENNNQIGYFRLSNYSKQNKNIYIGADIAPEFKGKGIGKQAYKLFMPFLFNEYRLHKITLEVLDTNETAKLFYKKLGFKNEGKKRDEVYKNGKWVDSIIMSILYNEFFI